MDDIEKLLREVREKNRQWEVNFFKLGELSRYANDLEKAGCLNDAIEEYKKSIEFAKSVGFKINTYARDIDRLVILYRKTKQYQKEAEILNFALLQEMHPNYKAKYKDRLNKVEQLINK